MSISPPTSFRGSDVLVKVENVSKIFCRDLKRSLWYGLKDSARELLPGHPRKLGPDGRPSLRRDEFWANQDISFELRRGECLGLIGHNGAGKTTLLKMLNGLIKPDTGSISMRGRVGALIALGAGFNPILTGRENVYVNAAVLGLSKREIDEKFDEIVDFADLDKFIDSPVQNYSSGMQVRLGFAIASNIDPDVLIIDEVLAVGDVAFRNKCYNKLGAIKKNAAVILVSHNTNHILSACDKGVLLENGKMKNVLPVQDAIEQYQNTAKGGTTPTQVHDLCHPLTEATLIMPGQADYNTNIAFMFTFQSLDELNDADLRIVFYSEDMQPIMDWWSKRSSCELNIGKGTTSITVKTGPILLKSGKYFLNIALTDNTGLNTIFRSTNKHAIQVKGANNGSQFQLPHGEIVLAHDQNA